MYVCMYVYVTSLSFQKSRNESPFFFGFCLRKDEKQERNKDRDRNNRKDRTRQRKRR